MPPHVADIATSLLAEAGKDFSRAEVAGAIFQELEKWYTRFLREGFAPALQEEWNRLSWTTGKRVRLTLHEGTISGRALGLDDDGAFLLVYEDGKQHRFVAGDISMRVQE